MSIPTIQEQLEERTSAAETPPSAQSVEKTALTPRKDAAREVVRTDQQAKDILDPERLHVPIDLSEDKLVEAFKTHDTVIVIGETGSGKTTRLPSMIDKARPGEMLAVSLPGALAVLNTSKYVARLRQEQIGQSVGYEVKGKQAMTSKNTHIGFMTSELLLRKIQIDPLLSQYSTIMIDEAHERNLGSDLALGFVKQAQAQRKESGLPPLHIVVSSATLEKEKFQDFFPEAACVEVPGRTFPIEAKHLTEDLVEEHHFIDTAAKIAFDLLCNPDGEDIVIFMADKEEVKLTIKALRETIREQHKLDPGNITIMALFEGMTPADQEKAITRQSKRKVVVTTKIAEVALTIDNLTHVIDSGRTTQLEYDEETHLDKWKIIPHAKSGCDQRKGRTGRTMPGTVHRLFTEENYQARSEFQKPEIHRTNLANTVLYMKSMGINDVLSFPFVDKILPDSYQRAVAELQDIGALDPEEGLTASGQKLSQLPINPIFGRMLVIAEEYGCFYEMCTIIAFLEQDNVIEIPADKQRMANKPFYKYLDTTSDIFTLLNFHYHFSKVRSTEKAKWAQDHFLSYKVLSHVEHLREVYVRHYGEVKDHAYTADTINDRIHTCIVRGLGKNLLGLISETWYKQVPHQTTKAPSVNIERSSALRIGGVLPHWMVAVDIRAQQGLSVPAICHKISIEDIKEYLPHLVESVDPKTGHVAIKGSENTAHAKRIPEATHKQVQHVVAFEDLSPQELQRLEGKEKPGADLKEPHVHEPSKVSQPIPLSPEPTPAQESSVSTKHTLPKGPFAKKLWNAVTSRAFTSCPLCASNMTEGICAESTLHLEILSAVSKDDSSIVLKEITTNDSQTIASIKMLTTDTPLGAAGTVYLIHDDNYPGYVWEGKGFTTLELRDYTVHLTDQPVKSHLTKPLHIYTDYETALAKAEKELNNNNLFKGSFTLGVNPANKQPQWEARVQDPHTGRQFMCVANFRVKKPTNSEFTYYFWPTRQLTPNLWIADILAPFPENKPHDYDSYLKQSNLTKIRLDAEPHVTEI